MSKIFNEDMFIKRNSAFLYKKLEDFLRTEINEYTFPNIYSFISLENFRNGEYEGNQYLIQKINTQEIQVIDIVSEEYMSDVSQTRFKISVAEMIELLEEINNK
ncbi:hypothetical protein [Brevibacillus sp. SYSU BS000544]|uniref:hypothetical protein n=1 Tax=Brevibacillus sp. SYSU BS000544 TaxID=3416443 RepID=UPI003CE59148